MSDASPSSSAIADTATFLLEIGVEELPYASVAPAIEQFAAGLLARLSEERLGVDTASVQTYGTPRRLVFLVPGVPTRQPDAEQEVRGPSVKAAFGPDGAPTKAAQGFATKNGVPVESLTVEGEYVIARKTVIGRPATEVLGQAVPELLKTLTFGKFMRWGEGNYRFGRPLRRFVALLGGEVVPFTVEGVTAGNTTVGHRFLHPDLVTVEAPEKYVDALRAAFVELDPTVRRRQIIGQANALAAGIGGRAVLTDALIEENVYLTEWVTAVLGAFDAQYLELPRPVLETAMKKHQRFFPVEGPDGNLLPNFIAIRSGGDTHLDTVRAGYEGVLGSRFNDAKFFYDHDRQSPLADKVARTERIVFQEKLGSLADKTNRLQKILHDTHLYQWTHDGDHARRAVHLAKADLATEIVMELPALQGVMGREFARLDGEHAHVAEALFEQYLPRFAGDALPKSRIGSALALADRTDTLVGYMKFVGAEPKGSSDPFGLKRAASAIVDLLARDRALPPVSALVAAAEKAYIDQGLTPHAKPGDILALFEQRLRGVLEERGNRYDLVEALIAAPWDHIASVVKRGDVLTALLPTAEEFTVATAATRVRNMLKSVKEDLPATPNRGDLTTAEEKTLMAFLGTVTPQAEKLINDGEYVDALDTLAALTGPIGKLFDNVMVMDEDPIKRTARLSLLAMADRVYLRLADFSKLNLE
jgi:glycyl-tRNA synthetase beta chain